MAMGERIPRLVGWEYHGTPNGDQDGLTVLATSTVRSRDHQSVVLPRREGRGIEAGAFRVAPMHTATIYELPQGNFVFDAGTCWWNMVLSTPPGFMNPARRDFTQDEPRVQRITANLLQRMLESPRGDGGTSDVGR
jgi:hypothetical protein